MLSTRARIMLSTMWDFLDGGALLIEIYHFVKSAVQETAPEETSDSTRLRRAADHAWLHDKVAGSLGAIKKDGWDCNGKDTTFIN